MKTPFLTLLLSLFAFSSSSQSTWLPPGDYRLYFAEDKWLPLKGVEYSVASVSSAEIIYKNYIQFNDFHGSIFQPPQQGVYTMMDSVGPLGDHIYYPQSDEVKLFKMGIRLPNHPAPNQVYPCFSDSANNYRVEAVTGTWGYSPNYNDSLLSFTMMVYSLNGQVQPQHPIHYKVVTYGKKLGLFTYSIVFNMLSGSEPQSVLLYSEAQNFGSLPEKAEDVFNYVAGNEFHSVLVERSYALVDSTFIIRKTLAVNKNGSVLQRIDSVYQCKFLYYFDSNNYWQPNGSVAYPKKTDTTVIDLNDYSYFGTNRTQTALYPFNSTQNQEYFIVRNNSAISPFMIGVGKPLDYASGFTSNPPYAYFSQRDGMVDDTEYAMFYPNAGGPYMRKSKGFDGEEEILLYVKDTSGERGVPIDPSLLSSVKNPGKAQIRLYPNPASESVHFELSESGNWQATLYTVQGQEIGSFSFEGDRHVLDLTEIQRGIYFIHFSNGVISGSARLVLTGGN